MGLLRFVAIAHALHTEDQAGDGIGPQRFAADAEPARHRQLLRSMMLDGTQADGSAMIRECYVSPTIPLVADDHQLRRSELDARHDASEHPLAGRSVSGEAVDHRARDGVAGLEQIWAVAAEEAAESSG